jgi:hypothetical protein
MVEIQLTIPQEQVIPATLTATTMATKLLGASISWNKPPAFIFGTQLSHARVLFAGSECLHLTGHTGRVYFSRLSRLPILNDVLGT